MCGKQSKLNITLKHTLLDHIGIIHMLFSWIFGRCVTVCLRNQRKKTWKNNSSRLWVSLLWFPDTSSANITFCIAPPFVPFSRWKLPSSSLAPQNGKTQGQQTTCFEYIIKYIGHSRSNSLRLPSCNRTWLCQCTGECFQLIILHPSLLVILPLTVYNHWVNPILPIIITILVSFYNCCVVSHGNSQLMLVTIEGKSH